MKKSKLHHSSISRSSLLTPLAPLTLALLCSAATLVSVPARAQPAPPARTAMRDDAALNFVGADIESVIKAVGHYTNTTFIIDPRVKGTLTLVSEKPLSKAQAFSLLSSQLRLQGYAIVLGDGFAKVVPEADAKVQPGPTTVGGGTALKGDQIATQIFRLNYESPSSMVTVLRPLVSPNNTINANPGNNTLIITDYADNLKRLGRIISALDVPSSSDIAVVPVQYAIAADLAAMVTRLMDNTSGPADAGRISLLADSRTNSLVLRAPSSARASLARALIAKLDQPTAQRGNVHVVYLKNAEATKLAQTLRAVISSDTSTLTSNPTNSGSGSGGGTGTGAGNSSGSGNSGSNSGGLSSGSLSSTSISSSSSTGGASGSGTGAASGSGANASSNNLSTGGMAGFIQADAATNTLIITCSEPIYRNLRSVIDQLDVRRAQVYIEVLIVELTADKSAELGIEWTVDSSLAVVAHALAGQSNANILSTPNLLTLDNEEAKIMVGQNVPFVSGYYTTTTSSTPIQIIERKDIGIQLTIKPQISEGGTIKMKIYQESSSIASTSSTTGIITNKRAIETNALADNGHILVLGGLIQDSTSDTYAMVPLLGNIPYLGWLFRYQTRSRSKTNLMVFLRPTIVRNADDDAVLLNDRYDYMRSEAANIQKEADPLPAPIIPDYGTPELGPLKNGRPAGGQLLQLFPQDKQSKPVAATPVLAPASAPAPACRNRG